MISIRAVVTSISLAAYSTALSLHGLTTDPAAFAANQFDYLVVGGGTAGLTVAARLTENPRITVGVIDAGQYITNDPVIYEPHLAGTASGNGTYDWLFTSVPQVGLNNRVLPLPRGKVLGGSSGINTLVFNRASAEEYDAWGMPGWSFTELLPYFRKAETVTNGQAGLLGNPLPLGSVAAFEGKSGPVQVSYPAFFSTLFHAYGKSFPAAGGRIVPVPENGDAAGLYICPRSVDDKLGMRSYAATAFFAPNQGRQNLLVLTGAQAGRVLFSGSAPNLRAAAVEYRVGQSNFQANASREVILSAGSYKTPPMLELSGIGNATFLHQMNITPVMNLPGVGENLQEHPLLGSNFLLHDPPPFTLDQLRTNATLLAQEEATYAANHTGLLTETITAVSFNALTHILPSSEFSALLSTLDTELSQRASTFTPIEKLQYPIQRRYLTEGRVGEVEVLYGEGPGKTNISLLEPGRTYMSLTAALLHPFSRGSVHISSSDSTAPPVINPNFLDWQTDANVFISGLKFGRNITTTSPLAPFVDGPGIPPPTVVTDADFEAYARSNALSIQHPVGSSSMAPQAVGGVVDERLVVYGTENLRIVDASIIPLAIAAHLQSTVYAIAEKASDMIKAAQH